MKWQFSWLVLALACTNNPYGAHSTGDSGKADFSYAGFVAPDEALDRPFTTGAGVEVRIRLHSDVRDTSITVSSGDSSILYVKSFGKGVDRGEWQTLVSGMKVGTAKLIVNGPDGKPLDTIAMTVADPAKIVAPGDVSMSVGEKKHVDTHVEDKDGHTLHVSSDLTWTLDRDVAIFDAALDQQTGQVHDVGIGVDLRGNHPGAANMHGQIGNVNVDLPVSVK
jgi:hypothetical protein